MIVCVWKGICPRLIPENCIQLFGAGKFNHIMVKRGGSQARTAVCGGPAGF